MTKLHWSSHSRNKVYPQRSLSRYCRLISPENCHFNAQVMTFWGSVYLFLRVYKMSSYDGYHHDHRMVKLIYLLKWSRFPWDLFANSGQCSYGLIDIWDTIMQWPSCSKSNWFFWESTYWQQWVSFPIS